MQLDFGMNNPEQTETSTWRYCGKMLPKVSSSFKLEIRTISQTNLE